VQLLMPLVEQAVEATRTYGTENKVTLQIVHTVSGIEVRVDSQRLLQILSNLLSNAIKFSPEGGMVAILVEHRAPKVRISVRDYGRGIPEEFRRRIFQKFAQADASDTRKQSGTGLGLAISRELAERMNGYLDYDSVPGEGACFFLELQVSNDQLQVGSGDSSILIVEDDADAALLLRKILADAGYASDIAGNGAAALLAFETQVYSAVVLDLMLPDMSGLDIIRKLRSQEKTRDLPIIVASAQSNNGQLTINGDFSGIVWLQKPVDQHLLLNEIGGLVERADPCRVLHIEDDADLHRVIRGMAGSECLFTHATSMQEARKLMQPDAFDIVMLDLGLPDGSGWDLLPDIKTALPRARLIILTGQDTSQLDLRKVDSVLLKSRMTPRQLLEAIQAGIG
jgi:DNA-binding response OmpR family regulator/anti-sigma regulatory factor (Ser/Thr protein kinase)